MKASGFDIHDAARRGNIATITTYIRAGGDLYAQDREGNPPLHVASRQGREASVAAFLGAGVDPAALNSEGRTPLYCAQQNGHEGCAALLRGEAPPTPRSKSSSPRGQQQQQQQQAGDGGDPLKDRDQRKKKKKRDKEKEKDRSSKTSSKCDNKKNSAFFNEDDDLAAAAAPPSMLPPPPPPTAPSTAVQQAAENSHLVATLPKPQQDEGGGGSDWHLCHDENGNAYYYSETTGESVWAEVGEGETGAGNAAHEENPAPNQPTAAGHHHDQHQPPEGWAFHHDPEMGHGYYLHEASATSVWACVDGSFPDASGGNAAAAEGVETFRASEGERGIGFDGEDGVAGDACTDWDAGILMAAAGAAGQRPAPTAPPPFSSTLELAELQAGLGTDDGAKNVEGEEEDTSMLLCTQGVMSTNNFFAAQQLLIYPSCSGGSPMASAPPAAESGGRRSSVSPLSTSRAGDDSKMWPTSPTAAAVTAEDDGESAPGNTEGSGNQGRRTHRVQQSSTSNYGDEQDNGTGSNRGESQLQSFVYPAVPPSSSEPGIPPTIQDGEEAGGGRRPLPAGSPAAVVRLGVWDTATVTPSNSNNCPVSSSQSNHFNINLSRYDESMAFNSAAKQNQLQPQPRREIGSFSRHGDGEVFGSGGPTTPSKYESLLEKPETSGLPAAAAAAEAIGGGNASSSSFYPKLVDRNGLSVGCPGGGGGGNGLQEDGTGENMGKTSAPLPGAPRTDGLDGSLAEAAERSLSMEDKGRLHRMAGGEGR